MTLKQIFKLFFMTLFILGISGCDGSTNGTDINDEMDSDLSDTDSDTDSDSDSDTDTDTDSDSDTDSDTDTDSDSDTNTNIDTDSDTGDPIIEPAGDECNTTGECQAIYDTADDCANSGSDTSRCMCGGVECWTLGGTVDTGADTSVDTGVDTGIIDTDIPSDGDIFLMADGQIIFDMESLGTNPPSDWEYKTTGPCDTPADCKPLGTGYYQWTGSNNYSKPGVGLLTYKFRIPTAGTYRVIWRNLRDLRPDFASDLNNDSWMAFPSSTGDQHFRDPFKVYGGGTNTWTWSGNYDISGVGKAAVCIDFTAGDHYMEVSARSFQHAIDRVAILQGCNASTKNLDTAPLSATAK